MRSRPRRGEKQRGVALLMVLVALTILGAMTADLMQNNEVYLTTTVNARNAVQAEYMARSGANLSRLMLSFQRILGTSVKFPFWKYSDMIISMFANSEDGSMLTDLAGIDLSGVEGLGLGIKDSDLKVTIIDEDSKININMSNDLGTGARRKRMWQQLLSLVAPARYDHLFDIEVTTGQGELSTREAIVCEILDWTDADEELCDKSGPEDRSIYQSLDPPYDRKNAPFDSLEELHLVSGINDDFWATFVDPNPEEPESRLLTVWGKGSVNVNTAPASVLLPLICMVASDENGAGPCSDPTTLTNVLQILQAMLIIRELVPFSNNKDFLDALAKPETRLFMPGIAGIKIPATRDNRHMAAYAFAASSSVFSIYSEGTVGQVTKRIHTVVDMKSKDLIDPEQSIEAAGGKVLYWRMD